MRQYSNLDRAIISFDKLFSPASGRGHGRDYAPNTGVSRPNPADSVAEGPLTPAMRSHSGALMRVNHAGEVAAQALYQGQGMVARSAAVRASMRASAEEEIDHLIWCRQRLTELGTHPSCLAPLWYTGSFSLGVIAGLFGDRWSLGFVAETERQVVRHLDSHLERLPEPDMKSRAILEQMKLDESHHATVAEESGAVALPVTVKKLMALSAAVMTTTAYRI